jgi:DMATS type aromatic prenyltransferase
LVRFSCPKEVVMQSLDEATQEPLISWTGNRGRRLVDFASERLAMLCDAAGMHAETRQITQTFASLLSPWGNMRLGQASAWQSEISDDNTPVEFSVTIAKGRAEVRVLFEPQGDEPTLASFRSAGLLFNERLEREFGASLARFRLLQDLFLPEGMEGPFAVWSSAVFAPGERPSFKAYFNPQARGTEQAESLVKEALQRLGLHRAWSALEQSAVRRGPVLDELKYFALDLSADAHARVKVYVRHHAASPDDLENASSMAQSYVPGEARQFVRAMRGGDQRLNVRAPFTCSSFVGECDDRPAATTLYVPICAYVRDDAAAEARVQQYLRQKDVDHSLYSAILNGFAHRPLDAGVGMQSWIALRRYQGVARLTVYLATEANRVHAPGVVPAPTPDRSALTHLVSRTPENNQMGIPACEE